VALGRAAGDRRRESWTPDPVRLVLADALASVATEDPALSAGPNKVVLWSFPIIRDGLVYVVDIRNGLYVLRYTGPRANEVSGVSFLEGNSNLGDAPMLAKSAD
jgi:hypothetical protein